MSVKNILAFTKKKFSDFNVVYDVPPSFLQSSNNEDEKVIFIFKRKERKFIYDSSKLCTKISENTSTLNLTGSPLKDDCNIESLNFSMDFQLKTMTPWAKDEENFHGIELEKVRAMISDRMLQEEANKMSAGSIWFLCKPTENDNTIMMGLNFENNYNSIGFIKYNDLVEADSINWNDLMVSHNFYLKGVNHFETFIENCYNIKHNIHLKLSRSTSALRPHLVNIKSCNTVLCQTINLEENDSVIQHFWRQLSILDLINEDIGNLKNYDHVRSEIIFNWGRGIDIDTLKENVIEAMTELPGYCGSNENDSYEIEAVVARSRTRSLSNITDKLWEILKCCSSYKDLKMGFTQVFQCAAQRNIVNMPINENSLAKIIREVAQRRLAIPCLTGTEPLQLLLEIGLEKLQKDYEYILTESKICGLSDLHRLQNSKECGKVYEQNLNVRSTLINSAQKFPIIGINRKTLLHNLQNVQISEDESADIVGFQNSKYNEKETELKLAKLCQIHVALEHLLSIQINLNLENVYNQIFEQLLQRSLQHFPRSATNFSDSISIPILTDSIVEHVENKNPNIRKITISSSNKFKQVKSTFYYNMENIYPPNVLNTVFDISSDKQQATKSETYFHSMYVRIRTRRS